LTVADICVLLGAPTLKSIHWFPKLRIFGVQEDEKSPIEKIRRFLESRDVPKIHLQLINLRIAYTEGIIDPSVPLFPRITRIYMPNLVASFLVAWHDKEKPPKMSRLNFLTWYRRIYPD